MRQQPADAGLPADLDLAAELDRLSGGDPLLVSLCLEELQRWRQTARPVTAAALRTLQPGFAPLFHRWLDEQERLWRDTGMAVDRDRLHLLLSLLACAQGPLRHADLAALGRQLRGRGFTLPRDALRPLASFLYGDGDRQGYVLSHPKLGDFLQHDYFGDPAILDAARTAFLGWSDGMIADLNAGKLSPQACPPYVLLYYRRHLETADAPLEDFIALTCNGWRLAREHFEGGPSGFGGDVAAVLDLACRRRESWSTAPGNGLGAELRCRMILTSLNSLGANTPAELLVAAVAKGVLSREQSLYLSRLAGPSRFCSLVDGLAGALSTSELGPLLAEAVAVSRTIGNEDDRATALAELAPHLGATQRTEVLAEALAAARAIGYQNARAAALAGLAPHLGATQLAEALAAARAIGDRYGRATALAGLTPHLGATQRTQVLAEALAAARAIGDEYDRATALAELAPHLGATQRTQVLAEALAAARAIGNEDLRATALAGLAPHLGATQLAEALAAARAIGNENARATALAGLAPHLGATQLTQALAAARAIGNEKRPRDGAGRARPPSARKPVRCCTLEYAERRGRAEQRGLPGSARRLRPHRSENRRPAGGSGALSRHQGYGRMVSLICLVTEIKFLYTLCPWPWPLPATWLPRRPT